MTVGSAIWKDRARSRHWRRGRLSAEFNGWARNRLRCRWDWYAEGSGFLTLSFGNDHSDPVWSVNAELTPGPRPTHVLDKLWPWTT